MPELPEVETTLRGISPHILGQCVMTVSVRNSALRYPVDADLAAKLAGARVLGLARRGKYLLLAFEGGHLLIHLGMSGVLRLVPVGAEPGKHDHVDIAFQSGGVLRFTDPRRFGAVLWWGGDIGDHALLRSLGPEPLGDDFDGTYLRRRGAGKKAPVKSFIMDSRVVVGVGNIYANEALYLSGIHPLRPAGRISLRRYRRLASAIRSVLNLAIGQGGTTLRDFVGSDGRPGYFSQSLAVYGRGGQPCPGCGGVLREVRLTGRSTVYCPRCQR